MSLLLDTGIVYAYYDRSDSWHRRARDLVAGEPGGLVLPAPVIPEVDHLLGHRLGAKSRLTFYDGIVDGYYLVADVPTEAYGRIAELNRRFDDLELGFVDAAVVALAESLGVSRIATTDRRRSDPNANVLDLPTPFPVATLAARDRRRGLRRIAPGRANGRALTFAMTRARRDPSAARLASSPSRCAPVHRPRTTSTPWRIWARCFEPTRPTLSEKSDRSSAMLCDTLATESLGNPVAFAERRTFPGAPAQVRLLVSGTHTAVAIRLRFRGLPWTTTTGRRKPGPDPVGSGRSAHQTSPCATSTTRRPSAPGAPHRRRTDRPRGRQARRAPRSCVP